MKPVAPVTKYAMPGDYRGSPWAGAGDVPAQTVAVVGLAAAEHDLVPARAPRPGPGSCGPGRRAGGSSSAGRARSAGSARPARARRCVGLGRRRSAAACGRRAPRIGGLRRGASRRRAAGRPRRARLLGARRWPARLADQLDRVVAERQLLLADRREPALAGPAAGRCAARRWASGTTRRAASGRRRSSARDVVAGLVVGEPGAPGLASRCTRGQGPPAVLAAPGVPVDRRRGRRPPRAGGRRTASPRVRAVDGGSPPSCGAPRSAGRCRAMCGALGEHRARRRP